MKAENKWVVEVNYHTGEGWEEYSLHVSQAKADNACATLIWETMLYSKTEWRFRRIDLYCVEGKA